MTNPDDLTRFQFDILAVLSNGPQHGLGVKADLETRYGETVNHGRLYPNLDTLVEEGLVAKGTLDKRTNEYALTDAGEAIVINHRDWLLNQTDHRMAGVEPAEVADDD
jgi:DNA-binding PadR family transcriptional regulator